MRCVPALAAAAVLSTGALAQSDKEHAAHHPTGASSAVAPSKAPTPAQMDMQMKAMQEMREKMMAEERQALMSEHMKTMQDGMAKMGQMHVGGSAKPCAGMSMTPQMMGKRMDMMETMMQMMMDREGASPAGK